MLTIRQLRPSLRRVMLTIRGSHHQFKHPPKPGRVAVPHPRKGLKKGTENSILKQAGLKSPME